MTQLNTTPSHHYTSVTSVVITVDIQFLSELFRKKQYTCNVVNKEQQDHRTFDTTQTIPLYS